MKTFVYESSIWLPRPLDEVFAFFSDASNLEVITPPWLSFSVVTPAPIEMRPGTLIDYRLRFRGFPLRWRSEITSWDPPHRFADAQVKGPYRQWIHEHTFVEKDGGTLAGDRVEYAVWGGALANALVVRRDVERIFDYRRQTLTAMFGSGDDS
ncbi:MAG: SRPBCC family protein [Chloroflexi bacterium]|nr:SRPBCC family protein [Chloroflexota bacterium]